MIDDLDTLVRAVGLKPHDANLKREQNPRYGHDNGLIEKPELTLQSIMGKFELTPAIDI
jgi:hypothetical protein